MSANPSAARVVGVTTWYLEMRDPAQLRPAAVPTPVPAIMRAEIPSPALNRFLYTSVGGAWHWRDRLPWTWERWMQWLDRPSLETWVMYVSGTPAGYVELDRQDDAVEIAYFGVAPEFIGRRLGGHLLSVGIERAWAMGAKRVWVHTCSLDHPAALANYQARGLTVYREETVMKEVSETPPGPWPDSKAPHPDPLPTPSAGRGNKQ
jgi:ribosomal protein S18 acetylase RimI-like enzyme